MEVPFVTDFKASFMSLLGGVFRGMAPALALSIFDPMGQAAVQRGGRGGRRARGAGGRAMTAGR
ncbi:hypothetical protein COO60DRAFT_1636519 [Scenedesmus sp. NREL 46B-D3]|nr:hypothetical protein COO60DRAFT_1636519 [Scenedesmus sp. NREL 46B-D3]